MGKRIPVFESSVWGRLAASTFSKKLPCDRIPRTGRGAGAAAINTCGDGPKATSLPKNCRTQRWGGTKPDSCSGAEASWVFKGFRYEHISAF